ncbi:MAG: IS200/IS605 family transposase [Cyclobacteriaceae bacterium]|nr:IS200/IS605 family transposase [Cyclobacteriaceae bacterium]
MGHVYTKLWTHAIFSTKNGKHLIMPPLESRLQNFIHEQLLELGCPCRAINGMPDHIHILFLQHAGKSIAEIVRKVKGSSSFWINQNKLCIQKFSWQTGYAAFAVSESQVQRVFEYISNQKEHHQKENFSDEYKHIIDLHGLKAAEE